MSLLIPVELEARHGGVVYRIEGEVAPGFEGLAEQFRQHFENGMELGANVCATIEGGVVADLWGGYRDAQRSDPWDKDTIVCMMSVNKAVSAACIFHAMEHGHLDVSAPVARYWPEFSRHGKGEMPVQWILDHRSGLSVIEPRLPKGSAYDHAVIAAALADMVPLWEPGTQAGYHILTQGYLLAEILRRTTGKSMGTYFAEHFARPLGLDYFIGVPESERARCAQFCMVLGGTILDEAAKDPDGWQGRAWHQLKEGEDFNSPEWRGAEISSANGHGNARAIARFFALLANDGVLDGLRLLAPETIRRMTAEQHQLTEVVMQRSYHQASGLLRNSPPICFQGPNPNSFGHHGVGGSIGFADPDLRLSFSYATNQMHARKDNGPRAGLLIQRLYEALEVPCLTPDYRMAPVAGWPVA